jgi:hypothetical protein
MSTTQIVKCKVEEMSKFGYKANGRYVNYSKQLSETDKARVVPGAEFEAEYFVADSGKEYLNKVLKVNQQEAIKPFVATDVTPPVDRERAKRFTPKFIKKENVDKAMTRADWDQKDRNMMIGGRSHDAAVITASLIAVNSGLCDEENALVTYRAILEGMLKIAEEVK